MMAEGSAASMSTPPPQQHGALGAQARGASPSQPRGSWRQRLVRPFRVRLIAFWHPSSLAPGPPPTTPSPPDALLGERFCCGRSRSPAAKARPDTSLKLAPKRFRCVNHRDHCSSLFLSDAATPVHSSYSLATPPTAFPTIWPVTL